MATKESGQIAQRRLIDVDDLLLDLSNFRIGKQNSQREAAEAIISEQKKKLIVMALDILKHGFSPYDLPYVYPDTEKTSKFVMIEGNRRLLALKLLLEPDLAKGTLIHAQMKKLHQQNSSRVQTDLFCAIAPDRKTGLFWVGRKHAKSLDGAGTEDWNSIARDRFDAEMGIPTPNLDVLDFVRNHSALDRSVADDIDASKFSISTLGRILGDETVRKLLGLSIVEGKLQTASDYEWLTAVLAELVTVISTAKFNGQKFTVRDVDDHDARELFINKLLEKFPSARKAAKPWKIDKDSSPPKSIPAAKTSRKAQSTSSSDRKNLIPKDFKLKISEGKVNDVYHELKKIDITKFENSVAVLLRVFVEFSVDRFMKDFHVKLKSGVKDSLLNKIKVCVDYFSTQGLMNSKELKGINTELANRDSFISPETLNAYVHNPSFSADEKQLKITWNRLQAFLAVLWLDSPK